MGVSLNVAQGAAVKQSKQEKGIVKQWVEEHLSSAKSDLPFSFTYSGLESGTLLRNWASDSSIKRLDKNRMQRTIILTDPKTRLQVSCIAITYNDYPTVEWTVYLKNTGSIDTPIIEGFKGINVLIKRGQGKEFLLHHNVGGPHQISDYAPLETKLPVGAAKRITTCGGRGSYSDFPYFNLEWCNQGAIIVVGWPGQWAADFNRSGTDGLSVKAGQQTTHFKLHPGEEFRSPLIVMQFWNDGDWIRAQNVWRRWMMAHSTPKDHGKPVSPMVTAASSDQFAEMTRATAKDQIFFIDRYLDEGLKLDYWWMDAGWYVCKGDWGTVGTWEVDRERFPKGLREVSDHAHAKGVKTIVWFEPERVSSGTWITNNHPEWVLGGKDGGLLNLGDSEAWNWLVNHIDKMITDEGIDLYRQDYNIDPLDFWTRNDTEDRQGVTENKYIVGYLSYWDELQRRHPGMLIDSCASGGKRNDLESMRRAVPLWRSDFPFNPTGTQCQTYGISSWIPVSGAGVQSTDAYSFRSNAAPEFGYHNDMRILNANYDNQRKLYEQWKGYSHYFLGDYYPLTSYSQAQNVWIAWQFDVPEKGEGMIQAFRRNENEDASQRLKVFDLEAESAYTVTNIDTNEQLGLSGKEMMQNGITIEIPSKPGSAVYIYRKSRVKSQ